MICDATHPEAGDGREAFHDLPHADLWNGVGCGGSQKCEIAQLDLIDLMLSHFSDLSRPKSDDDSNPNYQKTGWDNLIAPIFDTIMLTMLSCGKRVSRCSKNP